MPPLLPLLTAILSGLRAAIGASSALVARNPAFAGLAAARSALLVRAWSYIGRTSTRLARLFARYQAATLAQSTLAQSTLAKPRLPRPGRTTPLPATLRLPTRKSWIVATIGYTAAGHASQLNHLLARPDFAAFLAATPQAGRLLRPLCHILGIPTPPAIARPKPARKPRTPPAPASKPPEPPRYGKYPASAMRRYSPGKIPLPILRPA